MRYLLTLAFVAQIFQVIAQPYYVTLVKDICQGTGASSPSNITDGRNDFSGINNYSSVAFAANDCINGVEPWFARHSPFQQYSYNINPVGSSYPYNFFFEQNGDFVTYFVAAPDGLDFELCRPLNGNVIVLKQGILDSIDWFREYDFTTFFAATDGIHGTELWHTDGTNSSTTMIHDINPTGPSDPRHLKVFDDKLYFTADDGVHGRELWVLDDALHVPQLLADLNPGPAGSDPHSLFVHGIAGTDTLYFVATTPQGVHLFRSDGTAAGTASRFNAGNAPGADIQHPRLGYPDHLYFSVKDTASHELWAIDFSTPNDTFNMVKDIYPGLQGPPIEVKTCNTKSYFVQTDSTSGNDEFLWVTDGTSAGTLKITDTVVNPRSLQCFHGKMYFIATRKGLSSPDNQVWRTDGTPGNVEMIAPTLHPPVNAVTATEFGYMGAFTSSPPPSALYYKANYTNDNDELWMITEVPVNIVQPQEDVPAIYPNPATHLLHVKLAGTSGATLKICSILGQVLMQQQLTAADNTIDIQALPAGVYTVSIQHHGQYKMLKLLKQ